MNKNKINKATEAVKNLGEALNKMDTDASGLATDEQTTHKEGGPMDVVMGEEDLV